MYIGSQNLMRAYDLCLLKHGYTILELVDKASDCLMKHMVYDKYVILCGPGNNGADGLSLATKLYRKGCEVQVCIFQDNEQISLANQYYLNLCKQFEINVILVNDQSFSDVVSSMNSSEVVVDAMFGFGLNCSPKGIYQSIIGEVNALCGKEVIAVDIPTGLQCDTGIPYQSVIHATQTITLTAYKNGFLNPNSISIVGNVVIEELDVCDVFAEVGLYQLADEYVVAPILQQRTYDGYKGKYGHAGLIVGSSMYTGAALLSTKSSVYSGTGITTTVSTQDVIQAVRIFCPEAICVLRKDTFCKDDFEKFNALLIGCGLGLNLSAHKYVHEILTMTDQPIVIDADALTILAKDMKVLQQLKHREIILTPHIGEFKRLCEFDEQDDLLEVAKKFALFHHVVLVLKGPHTIITNGYESYRVNVGNGAMATGGMGDVLAGIIVSFLAQGYKALHAALLGVYVHGYTGDLIARNHYTVVPSQLIEMVPQVMDEIIKKSNHKVTLAEYK